MTGSQPTVGIVDYGAGNIKSIINAFEYIGARVKRISSGDSLESVSHLVLPGVGAFGYCSSQLMDTGLVDSLSRWALLDQMPTLGICVGMQLMAGTSEELGLHQGLDWLGGDVLKLQASDDSIRIPHVGWNDVQFVSRFGDFAAGSSANFYFDHSYALSAPSKGESLGICEHGRLFCAIARLDNVIAAQFHPEKSQLAGLRFLRGFLDI